MLKFIIFQVIFLQLFLFSLFSRAEQLPKIKNIRIREYKTFSRLVFDLDSPTSYTIDQNDKILTLRFYPAIISSSIPYKALKDSIITKVSLVKEADGQIEINVYLNKTGLYRYFGDSNKKRIILDVFKNQKLFNKAKVLGFNVNVREKPNVNSKIMKKVNRGNIFKVQSFEDGWFKILLDDQKSGYIFGWYLEPIYEIEKSRKARDTEPEAHTKLGSPKTKRAVQSKVAQRDLKAEKPHTSYTSHSPEAERLYNSGISFFKKNDYQSALNSLNQLIQTFPDSKYVASAYFHLALIYSKMKGYSSEAIAYFDLLNKYYPNSFYASLSYFYKGKLFYKKEKFKEAKEMFEKFIKCSPKTKELKEAKIFLAKTLFKMGWHRQAQKVFLELEKKYPDFYIEDPEALYLMGENYFLLKKYKKAITCLFHVLNVYPQIKEKDVILARIADCYNYQGQKSASIKLFKLTEKLYPKTEGGLIAKIRLLEKADTVRKINEYRSIVETEPDTPLSQLAMFKLATTFYEKAEYKKCICILEEMMKRYPRSSLFENVLYLLEKALLKQIEVYTSQKSYIKLINFYLNKKQFFLKVKNPHCFLYLGNAFKEMRLYDQAINVYHMADNLFWDDGKKDEWLFSLGYLYFKKHSYNLAKEKFQELISSYPKSKYKKQALLYLGKSFYFLGDYNKAKKLLSKVIKTSKASFDLFESYFYLGEIFLTQGKYLKALNLYKKAINIGGDSKSLSFIFYNMGKCYLGLNKEKKAMEAFNQVQDGLVKKMANILTSQIDINHKLRELNETSKFIK